jgi:hypothetical protein
MGSPLLSVMMLLGGLALAARSIQVSAAGPSGAFYLSLVVCGVAVFMLVRALRVRRTVRTLRSSSLTMREAMERWRTKDTDGIFDPPARRWGSTRGGETALSAAGSEFRDAARALLIACAEDEDPQKAARSRRAVRSACRRRHFRGVVPAPQPKRRRVRPRPRLFA